MDKRDRDALKLAIEQVCSESQARADQIADMLADRERSWFETASFCAFSAQSRSLHLQPWESPPCIADGFHGDPEAMKLLQEMLDAGISRYHPDPLASVVMNPIRSGRWSGHVAG